MSKYTKENPRFVWAIGAISEAFPDVPDDLSAQNDLILWDRQEKQAVVTVHNPFAQAMCLEITQPGMYPFTRMEEWFNELTNKELRSEGMPATRQCAS